MDQTLVDEFRALEAEVNKKLDARQTLSAQLTENLFVKSELTRIESKKDCQVYKKVGPALVPTETNDANDIVDARLDRLKRGIEQIDSEVKEIEAKQKTIENKLYEARKREEEDAAKRASRTVEEVEAIKQQLAASGHLEGDSAGAAAEEG